jgi:hypothetical protein
MNKVGDSFHTHIKTLDLLLGIPFTLLDQYPDTSQKRKVGKKGIAGRYVLDQSSQGAQKFIYTLPGNTLIRAPWVLSFAVGVLRGIAATMVGPDTSIYRHLSKLVPPKEVRNAINNSNLKVLR